MYYAFLLNMWVMKKIDAVYLGKMVTLGRITQEEADMIMMTPQTGYISSQTLEAPTE